MGNTGCRFRKDRKGFRREAQYDRLALLYVSASVQHGAWLIPGYHAAVDAGIPDAHDDPQNFNLALWAQRLEALLKAIAVEDKKSSH